MAVVTDFGRFNTLALPPDSTGKEMALLRTVVVEYSGNAPQEFIVGQEITGATSGFKGSVTSVAGDTVSGQITLLADRGLPGVTGVTTGELLLEGATTIGTVVDSKEVYIGGTVITSGDNPLNHARVDGVGNLYIRYAEGEPQTTPFGLTRTASPTTLGDYTFRYDKDPEEWGEVIVGGGSQILHLPNESSIALEADTGVADRAQVTSHRYHIYQPLFGTSLVMTVGLGDLGRPNNKRRWGMFDDGDGVYFELDDTTLYAVIRSSVTGVPVETRVARSAWSEDRLDGTRTSKNVSGHLLNTQNINIYWADFQWLGAGRVRFGIVLPNGDRTVCHIFENGGANPTPYMARATLPIRVESVNSGVTGAPSRIKFTCASIATEGSLPDPRARKTTKWTEESGEKTAAGIEIPLISFRPKATVAGVENRKISIPEKFATYIRTNPVTVRVRRGSVLTGPVWTPTTNTNSSAEYDVTATALATPGRVVVTYYFDPGAHETQLPANFGLLSENMRLLADGSQTDIFTWTIEETVAASSGFARIASTWVDAGGS